MIDVTVCAGLRIAQRSRMNKVDGKLSPVPRINTKLASPSSPSSPPIAKVFSREMLRPTQTNNSPTPSTNGKKTPPPVITTPDDPAKYQHKDLIRTTTFNLSDISDDDASNIEKHVCFVFSSPPQVPFL